MQVEVVPFQPITVAKSELLSLGWRNSWKQRGITIPPFKDGGNSIEYWTKGYKTIHIPEELSRAEAIPELVRMFGDNSDFFKKDHLFTNTSDHSGWRHIGILDDALNLGLSEVEAKAKFKAEGREGVTLNEILILRYVLDCPPCYGKMLRIAGSVVDGKTLSVIFYQEKSFGYGFYDPNEKSPYLSNPSSSPC